MYLTKELCIFNVVCSVKSLPFNMESFLSQLFFGDIESETGNTQARGPYSASDWLQFSISQSELITTDLNAVLHKDENDPRRYSAGSATLFETNLS